jgi:valyl-tRNA synthetase|tara:strand:+ start:10523 stop:13135 length:2613 start_codon:yes stop_codon:yes gene_type:complete
MELSSKFSPENVEDKWYKHWIEQKFFSSTPDEREPYTVVIPPPNVTGILHMGHMLNNTIQDVLIRHARMQGKNACWVPGTDHASIATETKVVQKLAEEGIKKEEIGREKFLEHAFEWKDKYGGIILDQLKKLGASCDWDRTRFTMEPSLNEAVKEIFVDLYNKNLVYRGVRMVNWDPEGLTAVSDEEVNHTEENSKLYYVSYKMVGSDEKVTIATTRPETILADAAVCVNPNDERFKHLHGKKVIIPLVNREVPIILDNYVDLDFGTGCLKVTPAHDENDYNLGLKHKLEVIDIIDDHGKLNDKAQFFIGEDRFEARKNIISKLDAMGQLEKVEELQNKVGRSERTNAIIEPKLSTQWFVKMEKLAEPALAAVLDGEINFHPKKFENVYRHWLGNVKDWCISRQLWWGQQIPAWYAPNGALAVANNAEEALEILKKENAELTLSDLKQDEDVVDTWFSSWLWPISVFDGFEKDSKDFEYYYPTSTLVTGHDIIFFWVARMIMAGLEFKGKIPFKDVYFTGMVRDKQRRKMSKQLGNSPDALKLIEEYGADGVRVGLLMSSPAGGDLMFDDALCTQGRNFSNKIWNSLRLIKGWEVANIEQPAHSKIAIEWFQSKFNKDLIDIEKQFGEFRISEALMTTYRLVWDSFCSWYLEIIKPAYQKPIDRKTYDSSIKIMEDLMSILHPFMPFLTEEVWHALAERKDEECIVVNSWPNGTAVNENTLTDFEQATEIITELRTFRKKQNLAQKISLNLSVKQNSAWNNDFDILVSKLCNIETLNYVEEKLEGAYTFIVKSNEYFIPLEGTIDVEAERKKLEEELKYTKGFLIGVSKKLSNERFVSSAPEKVVAIEKKKMADAESKIKVIEDQLASLK